MRQGFKKLFGLLSVSGRSVGSKKLGRGRMLSRSLRIERLEHRIALCSDLSEEVLENIESSIWESAAEENPAVDSSEPAVLDVQENTESEVLNSEPVDSSEQTVSDVQENTESEVLNTEPTEGDDLESQDLEDEVDSSSQDESEESLPLVNQSLQNLNVEPEDENLAPTIIYLTCLEDEDGEWEILGSIDDDQALELVTVSLSGLISASGIGVAADGSFSFHSAHRVTEIGNLTAIAMDSQSASSDPMTIEVG